MRGVECIFVAVISPESNGLVVQIELSNYSNPSGFSEDLINLSPEFFEKMAFSKVARQ